VKVCFTSWYSLFMANFYGFKVNAKQQVLDKAKNLFGKDAKVSVTGRRPTPLECKSLGIPEGTYYVECFINNKHIASAHMRNWRKAYGLLKIALENVFEKTLYVV